MIRDSNERDTVVTTGEDIRLPATLCMPAGVDCCPIAVLVHGSGALDRDETIISNKPFAEIAHELAKQGIATLRYDKRTYVYPELTETGVTLRQETIDDALSAIELAGQLTGGKVFLIGHSLGAMCAPWIASLAPQLGGIIMMAAPARKLRDLVVEQTDYLMPSGASQEVKDSQIEAMKAQMPQYFEGEIEHYDQVKTAQGLSLPILVLQGERDYQVRMTDFDLWQQALGDHGNVQFQSFPGLNHIFHETHSFSRLSTPEDYYDEGSIPADVTDAIARFIKQAAQ